MIEAAQVRERLEEGGLRCTPQRFGVMTFLLGHAQHPTAAEIFEAINGADPLSSRATTYNNLRDLVSAGLVREIAAEGRAARYDATGEHHHHFICDRCGDVEDLAPRDVRVPQLPALGRRQVRACEMIVRGLCAACAPKRRAPKPARRAARV